MLNKEIFRPYDIRGKYGEDFDDKFALKLGTVLVEYLNAKNIVVSRDTRPSSDELAEQIISGIVSAGANAIDIGPSSTPLFYFGVISEKAEGGIMVTASHLGAEFNGFKITREKAIIISGTELLLKTEKLFDSKTKGAKKLGKVLKKDLLQEYIDAITIRSGLGAGDIKLKIKLVGNEIVVSEARALADQLSIKVVKEAQDVGFEFDADGDRLVVVNTRNERIRGDLIGGLVASHYYPDSKIVYDPRYSQGVLNYMKSKGIELVLSRAGHTFIKETMRKSEAEFCAEYSGHLFFKEMGYVEVSLLAMLKVLSILQEKGKNIDALTAQISDWHTSEEINFDLENTEKIAQTLAAAKKKYADGEINEMDGLKVKYPNWNFLLRPSNTEAKLRLIVDAKTLKLLSTQKRELLEFINYSL